MGAGPSEGHQGTVYHPALRYAQDMSEVSHPRLSGTQQVQHWRCSRVPTVLASDDMQVSAVEAVDTAHHCSSQRPCLGIMCQFGAHCQLVSSQFKGPILSVVGPDVRQTSSVLSPCGEGHRFRRNHHIGVLPPNTRKSARAGGNYCQRAPGLAEPPQSVS